MSRLHIHAKNAHRLPTPRLQLRESTRMIRHHALLLCLALPLLPVSLAARAQTALDETRTVAADARVAVSNLKGSIRIVGVEGSALRLRGELGESAKLKPLGDDPNSLRIEVEYPSRSGWGWGGTRGGDTRLEIELPPGVSLDVDSVSADIEIRGVNGARVEVESVSGSLQLRDSAPRQLKLETVSGSQRIDTGAGEIDASSVSGTIEIEARAAGLLRAEAVSGGIELQLQQPIRELRVETVSGRVRVSGGPSAEGRMRIETLSGALRLELPADTSARIEAESFSGRIRSPVGEVQRPEFGPGSSLDTTIGDGRARIQLETFSGALDISLPDGR